MKYLGIDFGTKRIGIAISDEAGEFAFPHAILSNDTNLFTAIVALTQKEQVRGIVIGRSVASNEQQNEIAQKIEKFKDKLSALIKLPIYIEREDFSSVEAHRYQTKAGSKDDSAAAIILQRFLDKKRKIQ